MIVIDASVLANVVGDDGSDGQRARQELLQRLAAPLSPALQSSVNVVGDITYQQVRHAYIMLSFSPAGKAAPRTADVVAAIVDGGLPSRERLQVRSPKCTRRP